MDYFKAAEISGSGMVAQKMRIEAAAANIANMTSTGKAVADLYRPVTVVMQADSTRFQAAWGAAGPSPAVVSARVVEQPLVKPRVVHEPGHPDADANGMVSYPGVDHVREMMAVTSAMRAYEANLAALQATKTLALKALEIGGQ
ncbi:flagellar basal body rod protein FlgC [Aquabacterium sp. A7-Y]|uniref:flagellar basal body rod protein FlgC n=1 Tax=Aquabacterium sp. A7-Y TaxID=1349605 RepID=UPI00223CE64C|nr:flagellar basal body rod protein FlgC [Aquabacterium sp. A7-Y]MCW7540877.1 flagellar basal body rod protein FlgC [Aquabacterium sp. A7-Y]